MPAVKAALAAADGDLLAEQLETSGAVSIELDGERVALQPEEVEVRLIERAGMAIQGDRELLVALDAELTPDLVNEGLAREVIHRIQRARKERELDYADRIRVRYRAGAELEQAIDRHRDWIAGETLAIELRSRRQRQRRIRGRGRRGTQIRARDREGVTWGESSRPTTCAASIRPRSTRRRRRRSVSRFRSCSTRATSTPARPSWSDVTCGRRVCRSSARWSKACSKPASTWSASASSPRR